MSGRRLVVTASIVAVVAAGAAWWITGLKTGEDDDRFRRGETPVDLVNAAGATLQLFRAGESVEMPGETVTLPAGRHWLGPGRYFLRAELQGKTVWFPVPLTGYRCGPDEDGVFRVTIRALPSEVPPPSSPFATPFVFIPAGTFLLGDRRNPREPHQVWLPAFFFASFEVTNAEFGRFLSDPGGYASRQHWTDAGWAWHSTGHTSATAALRGGSRDHRRFGQPDQPVVWINWFEAEAYCSWLTATEGRGRWLYTLPTEAEWEKVARGPESYEYALSMFVSDREAWWYNWRRNPLSDTTLVGVAESRKRYRPNRHGVYHLTGNVLEWTRSLFLPYNRDTPYEEGARNSVSAAGRRVARGGSWYSASNAYLLNSYRDAFQPEHRSQELGLRIVARRLP